MSWQDIPGFSTDIPELYRSWVDEAEDNDLFMEVGVFKGRSLGALLTFARESGKRLRIYGQDLWSEEARAADEGHGEYPICDMAEARENLRPINYPFGLLRGASDNPDPWMGLADYVFIDADHRYESVKRDIEAWLPRTRKVLAGHDYCPSHPGVMRAVDELLPGRELRGCCWVWRIR